MGGSSAWKSAALCLPSANMEGWAGVVDAPGAPGAPLGSAAGSAGVERPEDSGLTPLASASMMACSAERSMMPSSSASVIMRPASFLKMRSAPNLSMDSTSDLDMRSISSAPRVDPRFTIWSRYSLPSARFWMRSSTVPSLTRRYTCTGLFCPMRCTRAMACRSCCGFQSLSNRMHVSAVCRFTPRPPARVHRMYIKMSELGLLNCWMSIMRWMRLVEPSRRL
mmetsp:Transcript_19845/g.50354  ORF Transcript_19845/g.50354 Transcript_19845/m.50354 type:complete len:223 (+) Transcript_19845:2749-3417(+)